MKYLIGGVASAATLAFVLTGAAADSPEPYSGPGPYIPKPHFPSIMEDDSLRRIGTQLVRRDDLTGAGVRAPSHVPEVPTW